MSRALASLSSLFLLAGEDREHSGPLCLLGLFLAVVRFALGLFMPMVVLHVGEKV